jgi:hypothetical protein
MKKRGREKQAIKQEVTSKAERAKQRDKICLSLFLINLSSGGERKQAR